MKKLFATLVIMILLVTGCTGINSSTATNIATDVAFSMVLQNNPAYKVPVVAGITAVKTFLDGQATYEALVSEISKQFPDKYAYIGTIILGYIESDKPVSTSAINLLDSYKTAVVKKLDQLLLLTSVV